MQPLLSEQKTAALSLADGQRVASRFERLSAVILVTGFVLMAGAAFVHRYTTNPDALSYLEVGEAWFRGDFKAALNGYWNPLYPILAAISAHLSGDRAFETFGVHALSVLLYVGAAFAFRGLMKAWLAHPANISDEKRGLLPVASAVFVWSALFLIEPAHSMADLPVLMWVLWAVAAWLRTEREGMRAAGWFGLFLGLGYLTKPILFPLGLIFLGASVIPIESEWRSGFKATIPRTARATVVFLGVCAIYIVPLSVHKGRFTFSDSGGLAYAWEVNGISPYFHWQGREPGSGIPLHPTREILAEPPTYEFDGPLAATYPPWFDASYWNAGLHPHFKMGDQLRRLSSSAKLYGHVFVHGLVPLILFIGLLVAMRFGGFAVLREMRPWLFFLIPCVGALGLYALVFVTSRYLAPFAFLIGLVMAAAILRALPAKDGQRFSLGFSVVTSVFVLFISLRAGGREWAHPDPRSYRFQRGVAEELGRSGIKAGDKIAVIGTGCESFYARIARVRIVAESLVRFPGHERWAVTGENLTRVVEAMEKKTAAKAVVLEEEVAGELPGWREVPGTPYRLLLLHPSASEGSHLTANPFAPSKSDRIPVPLPDLR